MARAVPGAGRTTAVALVLAAFLSGPAHAAGPLRMAQRWEDLSPAQQRRALENYRRYERLPERERRALDSRFQKWRGMSPAERERLRRNYESYKRLSPAQRRELDRRMRQWRGRRP